MSFNFEKAFLNYSGTRQQRGFLKNLGLILIFSSLAMWLWNSVVLGVSQLASITYWQALGFVLVVSFLSGRLVISSKTSRRNKHQLQGDLK